MKPYLLLRNNVQSGPYSADELRMLGLKAFDLIWIEGKSFSWKYPAEVDELRSFAPAVEQTLASVVNNLKERQLTGTSGPEPVTELKEIKEVPPQGEAKIVPIKEAKIEVASSQQNHNIVAFPPKIERVEARTIKSPTLVKVQVREKEEDAPPSRTGSIERKYEESFMPAPAGEVREEVQLETKFTQPLDNIRDKFIESRVIRAPKERGRNFLETTILIIGAVSLLGIGYLFGTSDKNKQQPPANANANADAAAKDRSQKELYELLAPERTTIADPVQPDNSKKSQSNGGAKKERIKPPSKPVESSSSVAPSGKNNLDVVVEKEKPAVDEKKEYAKQHINELVSVKNSDYKRKFLGGISGLKFIVTNGSAYTIDEVSIEVSYIKNNDEVFKTETVSVKNLWPGAVYTADAPSTNKGVKVTYKVSSIRSKDLGI